jgi:cytoskeletal protein CcmA (bactofilin family)
MKPVHAGGSLYERKRCYMFKKKGQHVHEDASAADVIDTHREHSADRTDAQAVKTKNTILKGNKLIGDINVSSDLELSGEIEGNITSEQNSNIVIKGNCRGSITTREGSVTIEGELNSGNITAGSNITISGKFEGGEAKAQKRVMVNGEFKGRLEADEIEIGPEARGSGEIFYKEHISIAKGAQIEGKIGKLSGELMLVKQPEHIKKSAVPPAKEISGA